MTWTCTAGLEEPVSKPLIDRADAPPDSELVEVGEAVDASIRPDGS